MMVMVQIFRAPLLTKWCNVFWYTKRLRSATVNHLRYVFLGSDLILLLQCESRWLTHAVKELMFDSL